MRYYEEYERGGCEAGQLILTLNGADLPYTVVGQDTGSSQIVGMALVETTAVNSLLTVRNPEGTAASLTITPIAGGTRPVSAHLLITQLQEKKQQGLPRQSLHHSHFHEQSIGGSH